jgi:hypothetical protein
MFDRNMKQLDVWDVGLTKFAVAFAVLAAIAALPRVAQRVQSQDPRLFLLAALTMAARPLYRFFK